MFRTCVTRLAAVLAELIMTRACIAIEDPARIQSSDEEHIHVISSADDAKTVPAQDSLEHDKQDTLLYQGLGEGTLVYQGPADIFDNNMDMVDSLEFSGSDWAPSEQYPFSKADVSVVDACPGIGGFTPTTHPTTSGLFEWSSDSDGR